MAFMKYGASTPAANTTLKSWGAVKTASVSKEEEEERKRQAANAKKNK